MMWSPTHVQVTVYRARELLIKGKNGTNDVFASVALGKNQFRTSVKQKAPPTIVDWNEQCLMEIPVDEGNRAEISVTLLHQNFIGVDEFLGRIALALVDFDVYESPKTRWYPLQSKAGHKHKANRPRGQIQLKIAFTVQPASSSGARSDGPRTAGRLSGSVGHLSTRKALSFGGSLLNVRDKPKQEKSGFFKKKSSTSTNFAEDPSANHFGPVDEEVECETSGSNGLPVENRKQETQEMTLSNDETEVEKGTSANQEPNSPTSISQQETDSINKDPNSCRLIEIVEEEPEDEDLNPTIKQEFGRLNAFLVDCPTETLEQDGENCNMDDDTEINVPEYPEADVLNPAENQVDVGEVAVEITEIVKAEFVVGEIRAEISETVENEVQADVIEVPATTENSVTDIPCSEIIKNEEVKVDVVELPVTTENPEGEMEEVEVDSVHNISESVPESEQEETFDGRVMIDKTRVVFEKNSCENQHFRMDDVIGKTPVHVTAELHDYGHLSKEELVETLLIRDRHIHDLSEYIDTLLLRVLNSCPTLLNNS